MHVLQGWLSLAGVAVLVASCDSPLPPEAPPRPQAGVAAAGGPGQGDGESSKIQRGYALAPVPLDLNGKNRALVGLGSYLVASHGCWECHTSPAFAPGGNPFMGQPMQINTAGYLAGGAQFGPFTSRNITPRANGLPAGLTLDEFILVIRTGIDLENKHPEISPLLQVMPWPAFKDMPDRELEAMYEYLRAIPCRARADQSPDRCG